MSYKDGKFPIFPYTEEDKQRIKLELGLKESVIEEDIDAINEWFEKQPHLIAAGLPERAFVERMLITSKGSRERTKQRIDNFYKYRALSPELIQNREEHIDSNKGIWSFHRIATIPKLYKLNRIIVVDITDPDPSNFDTGIILKNVIILEDLCHRFDCYFSQIWVVDLKNLNLGHLARVNPMAFLKICRIFMDGYGIRVSAIHVLGAAYIDQILNFLKNFVKPKVMERLIVHKTLDNLYEHIPKEYLPKEYGGDEISMELSKESYMKLLRTDDVKHVLAECSKQISDESKRPNSNFNEEFLNGSFKKLDID